MTPEETKINENISKILFTGLDDAGKTSIILSLQREFDKIAVLKPTRGADRRDFFFLGKKISEWDLGGQISYRLTYLKDFKHYFADTDIGIYVIDIQNKWRIEESLGYLFDIVDRFRLLGISPHIHIFLHKADPTLDPEYIEKVRADAESMIQDNIKYNNLSYHTTSIHNMSTIISVMSEIMTEVYPQTQLVEDGIKGFAEQLKSSGVVVMDSNSLLIGSYYEDNSIKALFDGAIPYLLTLDERLSLPKKEGFMNQMTVTKADKSFVLKQLVIDEDVSFYLLVLRDSPEIDVKSIESLITLFRTLLDI